LRTGRRLREDFLRQFAFDPVDAYCPLAKQHAMLRLIRREHEACLAAVERGVDPEAIEAVPTVAQVALMRSWTPDEAASRADELGSRLEREVGEL
jgi:V/A-type H+-transporting ATPase subunit A